MIQNYNTLKNSLQLFNEKNKGLGQIQKIYSTKWTLCLSLRFPGMTRYLYLGRGGGVEGVWEGDSLPPSRFRCRDKVLEYLRRHLSSGLLSHLELDSKDRILTIVFRKYNREHYLMYFWSGRKSFLLHAFYPDLEAPLKVFTSWRGEVPVTVSENLKEDLLHLFDEQGRVDIAKDQEKKDPGTVKELFDMEAAQSGRDKIISKKAKSLKKKVALIQNDLKIVHEYENLKKISKSEDFNLEETDEITLGSHHFKFKGLSGHYQKAAKIFEKIKKLQKAEKILEERLANTESELSRVNDIEVEEVEVKDLPGPKFTIVKEKKESGLKKDWYEFELYGKVFGIGKSAQGNDELRSHFASKEDWWVHLDGKESAHLIIKADWHQLSSSDLRVLVSALAEYSGKKLEESSLIPIIYTQVKYLKGVKGKAGLVLYKKEKRMSVSVLANWKNLVKIRA